MPLTNSGEVALVHKAFNVSNQAGQFNFDQFLQEPSIVRFVNTINHGDVSKKIGLLYNGLFDLHQTKRKVPVGSYATTTTDFGLKGEKLVITLVRRNANESAGDDDAIVTPSTVTLKRISAVVAHTVLTYINGRMMAEDYDIYQVITGEKGGSRVINALFDKYFQLPPFLADDAINLIEISKVYLGYVPGFDFLCTSFPEIVGVICCVRQNYPDILGLYSKSENLLESDKMQRIYQSIGTKQFKHKGRVMSYQEYMITPRNGAAPIIYSHGIYMTYFEGNIARRVSNNLSNISRFNAAILNLKGSRGLNNNPSSSGTVNNNPSSSGTVNNNMTFGTVNEEVAGTSGTSGNTNVSNTVTQTPGVNQHIPSEPQTIVTNPIPNMSYAETAAIFVPNPALELRQRGK